jgi:ARG and Rhodanese-Phosphatase-superfamily-associated Protein domain
MEAKLETLLDGVQITEPVGLNGLQVFGLKRPAKSSLAYLTLDEALQNEVVDVTEISEGGSVPTLKVSNRSEQLLFLMSGEQLQGAKQNRVLNVSIIVAANSDLPIPVSCVEAGRWRYQSHKFSSSGTSSHSYLRAQMSRQVTESYRQKGTPQSKQQAVWSEIARKLGKMESRSPSSALNQVYQDLESKLSTFVDSAAPADCSGAVFAFGGRVVGMDMFDNSDTFQKLWPKIVRSYAIDAMEEQEPSQTTPREVAAWLEQALAANAEKFQSPGLGDDLRLESETVVGSSLILDGEPVHTEFFTKRG